MTARAERERAEQLLRENDVVELLDAVPKADAEGNWPAGTICTVVSDHGDVKLVEISAEQPPGEMLDLILVAESRLGPPLS